jgi:hypothetical protein
MKKLVLLLLLPAFSFAQPAVYLKTPKTPAVVSQSAAEGFVISGNITGLVDGEVKITTTQGEQLITKGAVKNGVFTLKGVVAEPTLYGLP